MRVVVPFTSLHPITAAWLAEHAPHAELRELDPADGLAYWRLLDEVWRQGEDFVIIEHDMEPDRSTLWLFENCPRDWCTHPYLGEPRMGRARPMLNAALGCTRFRAKVMKRDPDLFQHFDQKHWQRLDSELATRLSHAPFHFIPCVHLPEVGHHHDYGR